MRRNGDERDGVQPRDKAGVNRAGVWTQEKRSQSDESGSGVQEDKRVRRRGIHAATAVERDVSSTDPDRETSTSGEAGCPRGFGVLGELLRNRVPESTKVMGAR